MVARGKVGCGGIINTATANTAILSEICFSAGSEGAQYAEAGGPTVVFQCQLVHYVLLLHVGEHYSSTA